MDEKVSESCMRLFEGYRKSRILARFILKPRYMERARYRRIASILVNEPLVNNIQIGHALRRLKSDAYLRERMGGIVEMALR